MADFKRLECEKCSLFTHSFATYSGDAARAKVFVCLENPTKRDAKVGKLLSGMDSAIVMPLLAKFMPLEDYFFTSAIRCFPEREVPNTIVYNKCLSQYNQPLLDAFKGNLYIAAGYWGVRMLTGHLFKEVYGKVIEKDGNRIACIEQPDKYIRKHIKWHQVNKAWKPVPGTLEMAKREFFKKEGPTIAALFGSVSDINMDQRPEVPFVRVNNEDEMINRLCEYRGQLIMHDYETSNESNYTGPGKRTALDWFYGPEYVKPLCLGYTFFQDEQEVKFDANNKLVRYPDHKVVVYTGPMTTRVARAQGDGKLLAFNATYDTGVTFVHTGELNEIYADPMDAAYILDQSRKRYNLQSLAYQYVPEMAAWGDDIKGAGKKTGGENYGAMFQPDLWRYCASDCVVAIVLWWRCMELVIRNQQEFLYWNIMMGTKNYLRDMETRGIFINQSTLPAIQEGFAKDAIRIKDAFLETPEVQWWREHNANKKWNPNSHPQVSGIYSNFVKAGLEDTTKATLKEFSSKRGGHTFTDLLLEHRVVSKLNSTYVSGLNTKMDHTRNLVFASFKTNTTATGRSSSGGSDTVGLGKTNQVNIQNIPRGSHLRTTYCARPGFYLAYADYSQIEIRVAGAYSKSKEIVAVCNSDSDFHGMMAAVAFKKDYAWVMAENEAIEKAGGGTSVRNSSKTISFGLLYGMTPEGLAVRLGMRTPEGLPDVTMAENFTAQYFEGMPSVKDFIDCTHAFVRENYYIRTVFGRIQRYEWVSAKALRQSVNTLVQASASDIFMLAIQSTGNRFKKQGMVIQEVAGNLELATRGGVKIGEMVRVRKPWYQNTVFPWAEVHDSMTWEVSDRVPKEELQEVMVPAMTHGVRQDFPIVDEFLGDIPLAVDFKTTINWV